VAQSLVGQTVQTLPPLKAAGQQADFQGGVAAATAALAAYYRACRLGKGNTSTSPAKLYRGRLST